MHTGPLEHVLLVERHPIEIERFIAATRRGLSEAGGAVLDLHVVHEDDGSCCAREAWFATLLHLLQRLEVTA